MKCSHHRRFPRRHLAAPGRPRGGRARCSVALIGQRILSCSAVPTAAALLPKAVSLAAPALAAFLAAAHWLHGDTFVEGGCVQCPGGPGAEPWSAGALATRCLRHGHSRCCVMCAQCSGLDACAWHFTRTLCRPWWFPSGCFVLAATVLLALLCFTGSDCVLHQLPRVLGQPRQIRTRANPSCAPIPRVLASFEHVRVPCVPGPSWAFRANDG